MPADTRELCLQALDERQKETLDKNHEVDCSFGVPNLGVFAQRVTTSAARWRERSASFRSKFRRWSRWDCRRPTSVRCASRRAGCFW
jgi:hypothetical protein